MASSATVGAGITTGFWWDFHAVGVCDTEPSLRHGGHSYAPVGERVLVVEVVALDVEVMRG
jgi:hypothetical protein